MLSEENFILYGVLSFLLLEYLWELYLSIRQHKIYEHAVEIPEELREIVNEETYQKARLYGLDKSTFSIVKELFGIVTTVVIILLNGFVYFWNMGGALVSAVGYDPNNEILRSAGFMLSMSVFNSIINVPFSVYYTFVLEERHGFNKQTVGFFIKDKIKVFLVSQVIMLPLISALVYIVKIGGKYFFIYLWLFAMIMTFVFMTIYPNCIAPLFDKYTPLPEGDLKNRIEKLAASIDFPLYKLYIVEGSKRSTHSNAYFYGFFKNKRIVLFDTLVKDYVPETTEEKKDESVAESDKIGCNNDEVLAVLAHELGHWKFNHIVKNFVIMQVNLFLIFLVFGLMFQYEAMYRAFGFQNEKPVLIGLLVVFQFIFSPYNAILSFLMTILSRRFEFQADGFAIKLGKGNLLRQALIKLNKDNLGFPVFDWMYSMWHHSHPPLLERIKAIDKKD